MTSLPLSRSAMRRRSSSDRLRPWTSSRAPTRPGTLSTRPPDGISKLRVTLVLTNGSVGLKCYLHPGKCTLAMAERKLPSRTALANWSLNGEPFPDNATRAQKDAIIEAHIQELKSLRDAAPPPGRTRQSLLDEARDADAVVVGVVVPLA